MKKIYKAAIVGCGAIAGGYDEKSYFKHIFTHAGAYRKHSRFELVAIADNDKRRLSEFRKIWNADRAYKDYEELFKKEKIDLLSVCVPDHLHSPVIKSALDNGVAKRILAEKPIAINVHEAGKILLYAKKNGVSVYVNYNRLWEPAHRAVRGLISKGFLGVIQGCVAYYVRGIKHNGTSMISTLRFLLGEEVKYVEALNKKKCDVGKDFALDGILTLSGGTRIFLIAADKKGYGHSIFEIDVMGNRGRLRLTDNGYKIEIYKTAEYKRYAGFRELIPLSFKKNEYFNKDKMDRTLLYTLDEIAWSLDKGLLNFEYTEAAIKDLSIAEALIKSADRNGAQIKI